SVSAKQRVVAGPLRIAVGDDGAHPRLLEQISAHASGEQVLPPKRCLREITCLDIQQTDVVIRLPSDDLRADANRHLATGVLVPMKADAAREEWNEIRAAGQARDIEHTGALEEEGPLLWKEQRKTRQIDLTDVRLGLGEVRVHGDRGV